MTVVSRGSTVKRAFLRVEAHLPASEEMDGQLEEAGLDLMPYDKRSGRYRLRLTKSDWAKHEKLVVDLLKRAYEEAGVVGEHPGDR